MQVERRLPLGLKEEPHEVFLRVYRQLARVSRTNPQVTGITLRWRRYANSISVLRVRDGMLHVGLSEALRAAPDEVVEALAWVAISKLFRRRAPEECCERYQVWLDSGETRGRLDVLRRERGRKLHAGPRGEQHDLEDVFDRVNQRYFGGRIEQPALGWSRRASRTHLGHWDATHRTIVISRILDRVDVPRLALDYVMYHEILHMVHPVEQANGRRRVHTRAFHEDERKFERLKEAKEVLKRLCSASLVF